MEPPTGGSPGVVGAEIDDRQAELTETIQWIEDRHRKWMRSAGRLVVADSGFLSRRLHSTLGNVPPVEYEQAHYAALNREPHPV